MVKQVGFTTGTQTPVTPNDCWAELLEIVRPTPPEYSKLIFTASSWWKLLCYINIVGDYEITGFGKLTGTNNIGEYLVSDVKILPQSVKSGSVDCNEEAMGNFLLSLPKEERGMWNLDWHSHVNMGVFYSGTDTTNYKVQWEARMGKQYPVMVVNKSQEVTAGCYIRPERIVPIEVTHYKLDSLSPEDLKRIYDEAYNDVATLCTKTTYTYANTKTGATRFDGYKYRSHWYEDDYEEEKTTTKKLLNLPENTQKITSKKEKVTDTNEDSSEDRIDVIRYQNTLEDYCTSCGTYLVGAMEFDRGLCDDCWEAMTERDRTLWRIEHYK